MAPGFRLCCVVVALLVGGFFYGDVSARDARSVMLNETSPVDLGAFRTRAAAFRRWVNITAGAAVEDISAQGGRLVSEGGASFVIEIAADRGGPAVAGETRAFLLSGAAPGPGVYRGQISFMVKTSGAAGVRRVFAAVEVDYAVPAQSEVQVSAQTQVNLTLPWNETLLESERGIRLRAVVENKLAEPADSVTFVVRRVTAVKLNTQTEVPVASTPAAGCGADTGVLPSRGFCIAELVVDVPGPGAYQAVVATSNGQGDLTYAFNVKRHAVWLFWCVLAGLLIGWLMHFWNSGGVASLALMEKLGRLREVLSPRVTALPPGDDSRQGHALLDRIAVQMELVRDQGKIEADVAALRGEVGLYLKWLDARQRQRELDPTLAKVLEDQRLRLAPQGFTSAMHKPEVLDEWAASITGAAAAQGLSARFAMIEREIGALRQQEIAAPDPARAEAILEAGTALDEARQAYASADWTGAVEKAGLAQARVRLFGSKVSPETTPREGVMPPEPQDGPPPAKPLATSIESEIRGLLLPSVDATAAAFAARARAVQSGVLAVAAVSTLSLAYILLYEADPGWGSARDLLIAALFGIGVGMSANLVLGRLFETYAQAMPAAQPGVPR